MKNSFLKTLGFFLLFSLSIGLQQASAQSGETMLTVYNVIDHWGVAVDNGLFNATQQGMLDTDLNQAHALNQSGSTTGAMDSLNNFFSLHYTSFGGTVEELQCTATCDYDCTATCDSDCTILTNECNMGTMAACMVRADYCGSGQ